MTQIYFLSLLIACGDKDTEDTAVEPSTEPSTEASTEPAEEPSGEPSTEPSSEPSGEPSTEPSSEDRASDRTSRSLKINIWDDAGEPSEEPVEDISIEGTSLLSNDSETYWIIYKFDAASEEVFEYTQTSTTVWEAFRGLQETLYRWNLG